MPPPRAFSAEPEQLPAQIAEALEAFLIEHPAAAVTEDGKVLFRMQESKYTLSTEHGKCTLQLWSEERNLVRRVVGTSLRKDVLRVATQRFGQSRPVQLEFVADLDRRTPSTREATRTRFLPKLERMLARHFGEWKPEALSTAMDLEKSFGPAYARGSQVQGQHAWAVIAVNAAETQTTVDGILTIGVLWLAECRERAAGRRVYRGLRMFVPLGMAALTVSRMAWMNTEAAQWELYEYDERTEEVEQRDASDHGNLKTHLLHAPTETATRERFADEIAQVKAVVPPSARELVEQRVRSGAELAFLLHGLEFARIRAGYAGQSFNRTTEITFGACPNETPLTLSTEHDLAELVRRLFERRRAGGDTRDPLYRMQPERWLESMLRRDVTRLDAHLDPAHVYTQVPAFAASDRGMLDLLSVLADGRLAVIELKADDDLHLALQGLDYWVRVRWHHGQTENSAYGAGFGLGEFQRHGYFSGVALSDQPPKLYLAAPALRIHPATEVVLRHLSPRVDWELVALDERWREQVRVVWRKRPCDLQRLSEAIRVGGNH
jgi:hypothetical protein